MSRSLLALAALMLVACGGSSSTTATTSSEETSSGGESTDSTSTDSPHASSGPTVLAVPLPGIPRDAMRPELQDLWTKIEIAVALTPPDPPSEGTEDAIAAWISGPYTEWVRQRYLATREALATTRAIEGITDLDLAFAAALVAYAFEDMAASVRGAPVPASIASDSHLVSLFSEAIDRALLPIAQEAAVGFDGCQQLFAEVQDPAWGEWGPYCAQHLTDLREVFGRYASEPAQPTP